MIAIFITMSNNHSSAHDELNLLPAGQSIRIYNMVHVPLRVKDSKFYEVLIFLRFT